MSAQKNKRDIILSLGVVYSGKCFISPMHCNVYLKVSNATCHHMFFLCPPKTDVGLFFYFLFFTCP